MTADAAREIEALVRAFLQAEVEGSGSAVFFTGALAERVRRLDGYDAGEDVERSLAVKRLSVDWVRGDEAEASLDASLGTRVRRGGGGEQLEAWRLTGPVVLRHVDGKWRIVDLLVDGHSMLAGYYEPADDAVSEDGVTVWPLARRGKEGTSLFVGLENRAKAPARLVGVTVDRFLGPVRVQSAYPLLPQDVRPGETFVVAMRLPHRFVQDALHVAAVAERAGETFSARFRLDSPPVPLRTRLRFALPAQGRLWGLLALGLVWLVLAGNAVVLGLFLGLFGLVVLVQAVAAISLGIRDHAQPAIAGAAGLAFVLGAAILYRSHLDLAWLGTTFVVAVLFVGYQLRGSSPCTGAARRSGVETRWRSRGRQA